MPLAAGPYEHVPVLEGVQAPFYLLRFDADGRSGGPQTQQHLVEAMRTGGFTDLYFFSHGWNNDFATSLSYYRNFIGGYGRMRRDMKLSYGRPYRPVLAGVIWPSTALVLPWEQGPRFAGEQDDQLSAGEQALIEDLAGDVDPGKRERFYQLLDRQESLSEKEARELAELLTSIYAGGDSDVGDDQGPDPEVFVASWAALSQPVAPPRTGPADFTDFGTVGAAEAATPEAAFDLGRFDPRDALRMLTVWKMKDRAGKVGATGVGPLLNQILQATPSGVRLHLIGHSYGARLLLSALAHRPIPRPVDSLLLLQPAVSHLCFADQVEGSGAPGGYRPVLDRVAKPILSTFSAHDFPLTKVFHMTLRRARDLGEAQIAAGEPPNRYAALGGFGPRGVGGRGREIQVKRPPDGYELGEEAPDIYGVDATSTISDHGDISNQSTWWALHCLARA